MVRILCCPRVDTSRVASTVSRSTRDVTVRSRVQSNVLEIDGTFLQTYRSRSTRFENARNTQSNRLGQTDGAARVGAYRERLTFYIIILYLRRDYCVLLLLLLLLRATRRRCVAFSNGISHVLAINIQRSFFWRCAQFNHDDVICTLHHSRC